MPSDKPAHAIVPEDFYRLAFVHDPQIAPDGRRVAFVLQQSALDHKDYRSAIWLVDAQGRRPRRFSRGQARDHSPRWSPDGSQLVFVSPWEGVPQLWLLPADGGEAEPLTYRIAGASGPVWSPDGAFILFQSRVNPEERRAETKTGLGNEPVAADAFKKRLEERKREDREKADPRVIERTIYRSGTAYFDDRHTQLYVLELATRTIRRLTSGDYDHENPVWSPDGRYVYCAARRGPEPFETPVNDLLRIPVAGGRPRRLIRAFGWGLAPRVSPDGQRIAYLELPEHHAPAQNARPVVIDAEGKGRRVLAEGWDRDVYQLEWAPDGRGLYLVSADRGTAGLYHLSLRSGARPRPRRLLKGTHMVRGFSVASRVERLAAVVATPAFPCDVYLYDAKAQRARRLTQVNAEFLKEKRVQPVEEFWYPSQDGTKIQGWLIKPVGFRRGRRYPLVVEVHGGPHVMWSPAETTMWHEWQLLAAAGYAVFFCNPRGSDGYGFAFKDAIHGDWGTLPTQDILAGVDHLTSQGFVDPERLCLTGGSYGGYMTGWLLGHDDRFAAAVAQRGVYDLLSFYGTTDVPRLIEWEFDARPWEDPCRLWQASPLAHVERIKTPLLILHSERDFRAPIPSAESLYVALKKLGRKVKFVRFPEEGHELSRSGQPQRLVARLKHILDWFDAHVKPQQPQRRSAAPKKRQR